jgi:hypothetical protein
VKFDGRLVRLSQGKSPERLLEAGVGAWYEAWIIPDGESRGYPVCFVLSELPPGLEPRKSMDLAVRVAGYSFKLWRYESGEQDATDPKKNLDKYAPLLIGHTLTVKAPPMDPSTFWSEGFVPAVVAGVILLGGTALTLGWWFRRGDRQAQLEIEANRHRNPF